MGNWDWISGSGYAWVVLLLVITMIANRLILRFYYKRKENYKYKETYYAGFLHATILALIIVAFMGDYPEWFLV